MLDRYEEKVKEVCGTPSAALFSLKNYVSPSSSPCLVVL